MIRNPWILGKVLRVKPKTIIHIGAHLAQDGNSYKQLGSHLVIWGEADSVSAAYIRDKFPRDTVIESIFWESDALMLDFYEFDHNERNSAIAPVDSKKLVRKVKKRTTTLDTELHGKFLLYPIMLVLDVQGAELHVLAGAKKFLKQVTFVTIEIAVQDQGYVETPSRQQISSILERYGMKPAIYRDSHDKTYTDYLFVRWGYAKVLYLKVMDYLISLVMGLRHLFKNRHLPGNIYYCKKCEK